MLDLSKMLENQKILDARIMDSFKLEDSDTLEKRILALLVEVSELANEVRCFKYWSTKSASSKEVILEEYVDGLHFILSLSITFDEVLVLEQVAHAYDLTTAFLKLNELIITQAYHSHSINGVYNLYYYIAELLKFSDDEITEAYFAKNKQNHHRQDENY